MKLVFLNGGLANQVFQYLFFRCGQIRHPEEEWILDDSFFYVHQVHHGYELGKVFGVDDQNLLSRHFDQDVWDYMIEQKKENNRSIPQIMKTYGTEFVMLAQCDNYKKWNPFDGEVMDVSAAAFHPEIMDVKGNIYYHGYWIGRAWFDTFQNTFGQKLIFPEMLPQDSLNQKYRSHILSVNSTLLHIRRGDYVTDGLTMPIHCYSQMISKMLEYVPDMVLFVFSDDPDWCEAHAQEIGLTLAAETVYVRGNQNENAFRDLELMSLCKNVLVSNSAFCYLATLLNQNIHYILNPTNRKTR